MKQTILTPAALEKMQKELETLKQNRKDLAERIERAKDFGDLSENFEYQDAKDAQGMNEAKILEIEHIIKAAVIQEIKEAGSKVQLGSKVQIKLNGSIQTFTIVSFNEANPSEGKISNESPIGSALIGHNQGEEIEVEAPSGVVRYRIIKVE